MVRLVNDVLAIRAPRPGLHEFTDDVRSWVEETSIVDGLLTLFCRHTSASLVIQENAAPAARSDLEASPPKGARTNMTRKAPTTCRRTCAPP